MSNLRYPSGNNLGGFNVPPPSTIMISGNNNLKLTKGGYSHKKRLPRGYGGMKKRKLFKEIGDVLGCVSSIKNSVGKVEGSFELLKKMLAKERAKANKNINKSGTQVKKMILQKGGTLRQANEEKKKHMNKSKEDLKKLIIKVQIHALKEINANL